MYSTPFLLRRFIYISYALVTLYFVTTFAQAGCKPEPNAAGIDNLGVMTGIIPTTPGQNIPPTETKRNIEPLEPSIVKCDQGFVLNDNNECVNPLDDPHHTGFIEIHQGREAQREGEKRTQTITSGSGPKKPPGFTSEGLEEEMKRPVVTECGVDADCKKYGENYKCNPSTHKCEKETTGPGKVPSERECENDHDCRLKKGTGYKCNISTGKCVKTKTTKEKKTEKRPKKKKKRPKKPPGG